MSKKSKKRNKKYSGWDVGTDESTVTIHKLSAEPRSDFRQWIVDHKKILRVVAIALAIAVAITLLAVFGF